MKIFKINFNHGNEQYIVAANFGEAERIWKSNPDRYDIDNIALISDSIMITPNCICN